MNKADRLEILYNLFNKGSYGSSIEHLSHAELCALIDLEAQGLGRGSRAMGVGPRPTAAKMLARKLGQLVRDQTIENVMTADLSDKKQVLSWYPNRLEKTR